MSVLDLDADPAPAAPGAIRRSVVSVRMPPALVAYVREQAYTERVTINRWLVRLVQRSRDDGLPADVREWLAIQAAQCGCPGDLDQALINVIRHLAERWPNGARMHG